MFNSFSKSILFAPLLSLLLGGVLVVSCGDDDNEEDVQTSSSDQNGGTPAFDGEDKAYTVNGVSFTMIAVKGGTFQMGSDDGYEWEKPVHQVTLSDYYIGETEVTQELWTAVMGSNPSYFTGDMQLPVECVSWDDCQTFISRLNELTGETFRLPTEAQWEYAARGGNKSKGYTYSGSNEIDDVAWYYSNSSRTTHPVKTKVPNELGIYDMSGNVWEWCSDWYGSYSSAAQTDPTGPATGSYRDYRGGGWGFSASYCRVAYRVSSTPTYSFSNLGLRLAH
ncbi:MAG: formylglycine-generating enzyme family protein [Bacteroidales bacterium]|nr:formylglycine-generating enzyme family protein [Bacteroidales bacterium]